MNLYYLGPEETFSHRTATRLARPGETLVPCADFRELFQRAATEAGAAAVVPFENTTRGSVTEVMDLLAEFPTLAAVECRAVPVHQHLLTRDFTTPIRRILSKEEALAQCRTTLREIYPGIPLVPVASTAEAARLAAEDASLAAVAGATTAQRYHLTVRRPDIQDVQGNTTRFFRLENCRPNDPHGLPKGDAVLPPTHALVYVSLDDRPGSLLEVLEPLRGINLTFIQSRPKVGEKWKYGFFLELLIGTSSVPLAAILASLKQAAREVRVLGAYSITTQPSVPDPANTTALSSLRAMIADIDASLLRALTERRQYHLNPELYSHLEPVSMQDVAKAFVSGDATVQTRRLRRFYLTTILPRLTVTGEDPEPREALHADSDVISALARRFRFSARVIARKRVELAPELRAAAATGNPEKVEAALLNAGVEARVLQRVHDIAEQSGYGEHDVKEVVLIYRDVLLPLSRLIQVYDILNTGLA